MMAERTTSVDEIDDDRSAGNWTRSITISLFVGQIVCWFAFVYLLFYYVPAYKMLHRDFSDVVPTDKWTRLVAVSDWVVINTFGDTIFPVIFVVFLVMLIAWNLYHGSPDYTSRLWAIWSIGAFIFAFSLLLFEVTTIASSVRRIIARHPEILDYGIWWINIFR